MGELRQVRPLVSSAAADDVFRITIFPQTVLDRQGEEVKIATATPIKPGLKEREVFLRLVLNSVFEAR